MENIKSVINNHNMKVLNNTVEIEESCNCRKKNNCPLDGKCLTPNIIYEAQIALNQLNYKQKQILNTGLAATQNHSTLNAMKTTQNYLKNTGPENATILHKKSPED